MIKLDLSLVFYVNNWSIQSVQTQIKLVMFNKVE